jgi:hypothetical protein
MYAICYIREGFRTIVYRVIPGTQIGKHFFGSVMKYNRIRKSVESVCDSPKLGRTLTINIPQSFCQVFHIAPEITCDVDFVTN